MAEFAYNNFKNASIDHILFELNCSYYPWVSFKNKFNVRSRSSSANGLVTKLKKLINICYQNFLYAHDFQKQAYNKRVKSQSYILGEKIWLNSKHIKTKQNQILKAKLFGFFQVLHPVGKQTFKLKLLARWKIYNIFHILLLE